VRGESIVLSAVFLYDTFYGSFRRPRLCVCMTSTFKPIGPPTVVVVVVTRSDQPKPPAVAIVRQNGLSSASCRASVAVTPVSRQIWRIQVVGVDHWHVSTPARAGHHPSSWYRFEGSGLPVHHFEVWRRDQTDPVFVCGRCMRRRQRTAQTVRPWLRVKLEKKCVTPVPTCCAAVRVELRNDNPNVDLRSSELKIIIMAHRLLLPRKTYTRRFCVSS